MSTSGWINIWEIVIGLFVAVIGSTTLLAFRIGGISQGLNSVEKLLEGFPKMRIDIAEMQVKLDVLWRVHLAKSYSPIALNDDGLRALQTSKIGDFANEHYHDILSKVMALKPDNAYQAQELLISVVGRYKKDDKYRPLLQQSAFWSGYDVDSLLFVAALSIRDKIINELGFQSE